MIRRNPYLPLLIISIVLLGLYCYYRLYSGSTIDINFHDTYYVFAKSHIFRVLTIWFTLCGLGYWIIIKYKSEPIYTLTLLHVVLSCLAIFQLTLPNKTYNLSFLVWALFLIGQGIYFLNIFISTIRSRTL